MKLGVRLLFRVAIFLAPLHAAHNVVCLLTRSSGGDKLNLGLGGLAAPSGVGQDRPGRLPTKRQDIKEVVCVCRVLCYRNRLDLLLGALANLPETIQSPKLDSDDTSSRKRNNKHHIHGTSTDTKYTIISARCMVPNRFKFLAYIQSRVLVTDVAFPSTCIREHPRASRSNGFNANV